MSEKFKVGDSVHLKSDSSIMTVEGFDYDNKSLVKCCYKSGGKVVRETFHEDVITHDNPDKYNVITI